LFAGAPKMSRHKYRILFAKTEAMRFTGHLDLQRVWERLLRRAQVPLAYSAGYHPHPKIQIGAALPLGVTGENELVDIETAEECDAETLARQISNSVPPGLSVHRVTALSENSTGLEKLVLAGEYSAVPLEGEWPEDLPQRIQELMVRVALPRERRGKTYDLRPRILSLALDGNTPALAEHPGPDVFRELGRLRSGALRMRLSLTQDATGRPDEVLSALGLDSMPVEVKRERIVMREADHGP
jgi:radical SAM-linked protein